MSEKNIFETKIEFIKGVGPKRATILNKELGVYKFSDLIEYFPYRYEDRTLFVKINKITPSLGYVNFIGRVVSHKTVGYKNNKRLVVKIKDESGSVELVWFKGVSWIEKKISVGKKYNVFGKATLFNNLLNITHPEISFFDANKKGYFQPIYNTTEILKKRYLNSSFIEKLTRYVLQKTYRAIPESIPEDIMLKHSFIKKKDAVLNIHFPSNRALLQKAIGFLKFEEFFYLQLKILSLKKKQEVFSGYAFKKNLLLSKFYNKHLPFSLTEAQKRVVKECYRDMSSGKQMNRLIQGDVGSGKTIVAFLCMLLAVEEGTQVAFMAPTEVLAEQHYSSISTYCDFLGVSVELLTGSTKAPKRGSIFDGIKKGSIKILVGTHSLIEKKVVFKKLGLAIIDEQHKFGVEQRARLWGKKEKYYPHILVMTATPIPRTLALTLYGDLDVSVIDELPAGRKEIITSHRNENARLRVFGFIKKTIENGNQVYVVYPLIEESKKQDYKDLMDGYESFCRSFPKTPIGVLHGKMKPKDKDFEMKRFKEGKSKILISTTVIEVGVDVPNATVMVIESAERFGLSQIHQLRGRVGRGESQSYCILMTKYKLSNDAKERISALVGTSDGFKIADIDLKIRGPGNLTGTQQSGILNLKIGNLSEDSDVLNNARKAAQKIILEDPGFELSKNKIIVSHIKKNKSLSLNWSRIS